MRPNKTPYRAKQKRPCYTLELDRVVLAQHYEHCKSRRIVHFKMVNSMLCKFHLHFKKGVRKHVVAIYLDSKKMTCPHRINDIGLMKQEAREIYKY